MDEDRLYIPQLEEIGGKMCGTASFVRDRLENIKTDVRSRKLGPNKADFEALRYVVDVLADELYELGQNLHMYDRYLKENGILERWPTVKKNQFDE